MVADRAGAWVMLVTLVWPAAAMAQTAEQLDNAVKFGAIATLGPICELRDEAWATDLRRAELRAMGVPARPEPDQRTLADRAGAALSYAEDEALEDFAEALPEVGCARLAQNPDLRRADDLVGALRSGKGIPVW